MFTNRNVAEGTRKNCRANFFRKDKLNQATRIIISVALSRARHLKGMFFTGSSDLHQQGSSSIIQVSGRVIVNPNPSYQLDFPKMEDPPFRNLESSLECDRCYIGCPEGGMSSALPNMIASI
jgi:hypothetical protein